MAITIVSQPSSITPSRNPVRWVLQTDNFIISNGVKAINKFTVSGAVSSFELIDFIYGNEEFSMVAVNAPAAPTGYNLPTGDGGTSHKGNLLLYFKANYYLDRDFDITLVGNDFIFTAKEVGADYNMTDSTETFVNGAFSFPTAGVDYQEQENFKIAVDVYVEVTGNTNVYKKLETKYFIPDSNSRIDIDIQEELHAYLKREENSPSYNQTAYSQCYNINKRYYIKYCEFYGTTPVFFTQLTSSTYRVIKGGLKRELWPPVASDFRLQWLGNPLSSASFLPRFFITRRAKRTATKIQQEYLYLCPAAALSNVRLRARVEYSNATASIATIASYSVLGQGITFLFPAGYTQLNLAALEAGRTPVRWFIYIDNAAGILKSEMICYEITDIAFIEKYFIYENSLGAWETLRTSGQRSHGSIIEKTEFQGITSNNYAATDTEIISTTESYQETYEQYTGNYFTKDEAQDLIDMLKGEKLYELVNGKKVPVNVEAAEYFHDKDDNYQYGVMFKYRPAYKQVNYGWR